MGPTLWSWFHLDLYSIGIFPIFHTPSCFNPIKRCNRVNSKFELFFLGIDRFPCYLNWILIYLSLIRWIVSNCSVLEEAVCIFSSPQSWILEGLSPTCLVSEFLFFLMYVDEFLHVMLIKLCLTQVNEISEVQSCECYTHICVWERATLHKMLLILGFIWFLSIWERENWRYNLNCVRDSLFLSPNLCFSSLFCSWKGESDQDFLFWADGIWNFLFGDLYWWLPTK